MKVAPLEAMQPPVFDDEGESELVTAIDTDQQSVTFVVDAVRKRYYINDGKSIFAHDIKQCMVN